MQMRLLIHSLLFQLRAQERDKKKKQEQMNFALWRRLAAALCTASVQCEACSEDLFYYSNKLAFPH